MGLYAGLLLAAIALFPRSWVGATAARICGAGTGAGTDPTYQWSVNDWRYDGPDPKQKDTTAIVRTTLTPGGTRTLFTCFSQWPDAWGGLSENGTALVWNDCVWTGPGDTSDVTVSFAMDWKTRTVYVSHTFVCSDAARRGTTVVATGSVVVDLDCSSPVGDSPTCFTKADRYNLVTKQDPAALTVASASACLDSAHRNHSWTVQGFSRHFDQNATGTTETAMSFALQSMSSSGDAFNCSLSGAQKAGHIDGVCQPSAAAGTTGSTARFRYDTALDILTIIQSWICGDSGKISFDAVGVGYLQARCDRKEDSFDCALDPFWVGGTVQAK